MRTLFPGAVVGSVDGFVDWTGGANLDDIAPEDQVDWTFVNAGNSSSGLLEPGYDEVWDGKVEPQEPIVANENESWGKVKTRF